MEKEYYLNYTTSVTREVRLLREPTQEEIEILQSNIYDVPEDLIDWSEEQEISSDFVDGFLTECDEKHYHVLAEIY